MRYVGKNRFAVVHDEQHLEDSQMFAIKLERTNQIMRELAASGVVAGPPPTVPAPVKDDIDLRSRPGSAALAWLDDAVAGRSVGRWEWAETRAVDSRSSARNTTSAKQSDLERRAAEAKREAQRLAEEAQGADTGMAFFASLFGDDRGAGGSTNSTHLSEASTRDSVRRGDD